MMIYYGRKRKQIAKSSSSIQKTLPQKSPGRPLPNFAQDPRGSLAKPVLPRNIMWGSFYYYLPANKHSNGKSPSWIGNTSSNGGFSIAVLDYRSVSQGLLFFQRLQKKQMVPPVQHPLLRRHLATLGSGTTKNHQGVWRVPGKQAIFGGWKWWNGDFTHHFSMVKIWASQNSNWNVAIKIRGWLLSSSRWKVSQKHPSLTRMLSFGREDFSVTQLFRTKSSNRLNLPFFLQYMGHSQKFEMWNLKDLLKFPRARFHSS